MPTILHVSRQPGIIDVLIVFDDESVTRIQKQDPYEMNLDQLMETIRQPLHQIKIRSIAVVYANEADMVHIISLAKAGKINEAIAFAIRGWDKFDGDHDAGPVSLKNPAKA